MRSNKWREVGGERGGESEGRDCMRRREKIGEVKGEIFEKFGSGEFV